MRRPYKPLRRVRLGQLGSLSPAQIQQLAANAGFSGDDLATAVAIALAESGGNPSDYNPESAAAGGTPQGQGSYGLWQIYLKMHPEFAGQNLFDPQTNANAAFSVYSRRGGFSDWTTYNTGAYQGFLSQVQPPLTIDASTGLPIEDLTPTPDLTAASLFAPSSQPPSTGTLLGIAGAAVGIYLVLDAIS